jgi:hypothetical protein
MKGVPTEVECVYVPEREKDELKIVEWLYPARVDKDGEALVELVVLNTTDNDIETGSDHKGFHIHLCHYRHAHA